MSSDTYYLSYENATPVWFTCSFTPASQGSHVYKIRKRCDRNIFGSKITDNKNIFGGTSCALIESEHYPKDQAEEASENGEETNEESLNLQFTGVFGDNASATNAYDSLRIRFAEEEIPNSEVVASAGGAARIEEDAIETMSKNWSRFSERDQIKDDKVRRLQHVAAFPSENTLRYLVKTNWIRNNPISRKDIKIFN